MIRLPDMQSQSPLDARTFLVSFCALAREIYPDLDWDTVAPKLQRSWDRAHGEHGFRWAEVSESARIRWEAGR
jgi:hypothetical protein